MLFQPFNEATRPDTPGFLDAAIQQGNFENIAKSRENALRSQNMIGAGELYNASMGDRSPIADSIFGEAAPVAPTGAEAAGGASAIAPTVPAGTAIAGGAPGATTALAGPASAVGLAPVAGAAAPPAAAGLAAMGPAGWAAAAMLALNLL